MHNPADLMDSTFMLDRKAVVGYDGHVTVSPMTQLSAICVMDLTVFPFDDANCGMKFGSWTYDNSALKLKSTSEKADLSKYSETRNWIISDSLIRESNDRVRPVPVHSTRRLLKIDRTVLKIFSDVEMVLTLKRQYYSHYVYYIFIPTSIVQIITLLSLWIQPRDGERVSLVVGLILVHVVFLLVVSRNLPRSKTNVVPMISKF